MKIINISIPDDLEESTIENENVDVFVETDDGYTYTVSVATPKHLQFLMDKEKMNYYGPGYPFIFVSKLTPENIEQAAKVCAENELDVGFRLKIYHFAGWRGAIDENIFDRLKAEQIERRKESDELDDDELD